MTKYISYDDIIRLEHPNLVSHDQWTKFTVPKIERSIFYVYVYLDPTKPGLWKADKYTFKYEPFYVGMGSGSRSTSHLKAVLRGSTDKKNKHKSRRILKILKYDKSPIIKILLQNTTRDNAMNQECVLISALGRRNLKTGPLTNKTDGGEGAINYKHSNKTKELISQRQIDRFFSMSDEDRAQFVSTCTIANKKRYELASEEEELSRKQAIREGVTKSHASMSEFKKRMISDKIRNTILKIRNNMSPQERELESQRMSNIQKAFRLRQTDEQKAIEREKFSEGQKRYHQNMTDEQRLVYKLMCRNRGYTRALNTAIRNGTVTRKMRREYEFKINQPLEK